jgi:hypothetical protein
LRIFIPNFAEIIKLITTMIKKDNKVKWTIEAKSSFKHVKEGIGEAPVLVIPEYTKDLLFSLKYSPFASEMQN